MTAGVRRCRSRPCCVFGLQGPSRPQELCAGTLPGHDAERVRDLPPSQSLRGRETGWRAVSVTAPIPAVPGQAFSCPWLSGTRGARTCSGRRRPQTFLAARIRWSARLTRVEGERSVKPSAQPTLVRTQHLPPPPATTCENGPLAANSRASGPFLLCPVVCHLVALRAAVSRYPRTHR